MLWETPEGEIREEQTQDQQDRIIWIDTSAMVVDERTKAKKSDTLIKLLRTRELNICATDKSILLQIRKSKLKQQKKLDADANWHD